jgi:hypothetical protein
VKRRTTGLRAMRQFRSEVERLRARLAAPPATWATLTVGRIFYDESDFVTRTRPATPAGGKT